MQHWVDNVVFSPDGNTIAGDNGETIHLWNVNTGEPIRTLTGHTGFVSSIAYSPDGSTLASGSSDSTIRLWNANTGETIRTLTGHTSTVVACHLVLMVARLQVVGIGRIRRFVCGMWLQVKQ